ncbi:hypothetical protein [Mycobacterium sp. 94-17]|uniref:hypothetical protein n=1 Tax=Mycobacterium sp. 94-17 TaxID=2986147 RepID=UPI002D1F7D73|nr:hypothetical protein [Mycobacterium sp. 94-17]MEB4207743.1 hypothetical protein [Mycobacterium sp. 94-17]
MSLIVLNNPAEIPWQTNVFDLLMLTMFVAAVVHTVVQFRRGRRIYAAVLIAAFVYGLILELAGMATLNMYVQGDFLVMLNWTAIPLWKGTTMMPFYVTIFYPVFLFTGFKVVEALGIKKRWQAAATGGLFMIALDAPYIIEGNLRHVVWWTWDPNFTYFQYWVGWPLVDMCWQGLWDALFIYVALWALPRIDGTATAPARWSTAKALGAFPPLAALAVLVGGPILMSPLTVVSALKGPQWPLAALLVATYCAIAVTALRSARVNDRVEPVTALVVGLYVVSFGTFVIGNVVHEGGITSYLLVQTLGLVVTSGFALSPIVVGARRRAVHSKLPNRASVEHISA